MSTLTLVLVVLISLEFIYIMYLETFATNSDTTSRVFNMNKEELSRKSVETLFKNQGIYNGLLSFLLLYGAFFSNASKEITVMLLIYIILVAIYGSLTSSKSIILKQGGLPILALITMLF